MSTVKISKWAYRQLKKIPRHVVINLMARVDDVEKKGIEEARKRPGYHDEPLKGQRRHQRSIRLSRSYRAIYEIVLNSTPQIISVEEVSKHDY